MADERGPDPRVETDQQDPQQPIKVCQTTLSSENSYIFITNIQIPSVHFQEPNLSHRIYTFVTQEYSPEIQPYFEITGTYTLQDSVTGSVRRWVGSFSPQQAFGLTPILTFRESFHLVLRPLLNPEYLKNQISQLVPDTVWIVDNVDSLIINISGIVPLNYPRLLQRGLVSQHGRRTQRKIKTSFLP